MVENQPWLFPVGGSLGKLWGHKSSKNFERKTEALQ